MNAQPPGSGSCIAVSPTMRLQYEPAQQCHVLLYPEGMVQLNPSAAAILELCDGSRTLEEIAASLQARFPGTGELINDVAEFVEVASARGWVRVV